MRDAAFPSGDVVRPSAFTALPALLAGALVWLIGAIAIYARPHLAGTAFALTIVALSGVVVGLMARRGRRALTFAVMAGLGAGAQLFLDVAWAYYSILLPLYAALVAAAVLGAGFLLGAPIARFLPRRRFAFAAIALVVAGQLWFILYRDGYILWRHARPREVAFGHASPSWFFFTQGERVQGLTYIAKQSLATNPERAQRLLEKALAAATHVPSNNWNMVSSIASTQIEMGFFDDAVSSVQQIAGPFHRRQAMRMTGVKLSRAGAPMHARRLFAELLRELPQLEDLVSWVQNISRSQIEAGFHQDAQATVTHYITDPAARQQQLLLLAIDLVKAGARAEGEQLFQSLFKSADALPTPALRAWGVSEIAYYQAKAGLDDAARRSADHIDSEPRRREILAYLAKPMSQR